MLRARTGYLGAVLFAATATGASAQFTTPGVSPFSPSAGAIPGTTGIPSAGALGAGAGVMGAGGAGGGGMTLCGFLGLTPAKFAACRAMLCQTQFGQLLNGGTQPLGAVSGGLFPSFCPPTSAFGPPVPGGDPTGAQSVASAVEQDTANAKARVAAIEYLGTVDCHYWPDAAIALANGLRADRNECVRYAAARVLGTGCCCTKKTIDALTLTVTGADTDGNPSETSERVKGAALVALQNCMLHYQEKAKPATPPEAPDEPLPPEAPDDVSPVRLSDSGGASRLSPYDRALARKPIRVVMDDARRAIALGRAHRIGAGMVTGRRNVYQAMRSAAPNPDAPATSTALPARPASRRTSVVPPPRPAPITLTPAAPEVALAAPPEEAPGRPEDPAPANQKSLYHILVRSVRNR